MNIQEIAKLISDKHKIVVAQADNPDGDSVASALALEQILYDLGKEPILYCAIDIPKHLRHLPGWDRIDKDVPHNFDMTIIVDCSSRNLFEVADKRGQLSWILAKPLLIIDHHDVVPTINATLIHNNTKAVSTGEAIYELSKHLKWPLSLQAKNMLAVSILSDSLGLMTEATTPRSIRIIAELVESGVNLPKLEEARRLTLKKSIELTHYKGELLSRIELYDNERIAIIVIPWGEIEKYSSQYNPSILVIEDMRLIDGVQVAIAFKTYHNGRITAKIRSNYGSPIAKQLAEAFNAGGHEYASGFKVNDYSLEDVKERCIKKASELLNNLSRGTSE